MICFEQIYIFIVFRSFLSYSYGIHCMVLVEQLVLIWRDNFSCLTIVTDIRVVLRLFAVCSFTFQMPRGKPGIVVLGLHPVYWSSLACLCARVLLYELKALYLNEVTSKSQQGPVWADSGMITTGWCIKAGPLTPCWLHDVCQTLLGHRRSGSA